MHYNYCKIHSTLRITPAMAAGISKTRYNRRVKRLGRWLFNFAAGASLLLCAATIVFWMRSYGQGPDGLDIVWDDSNFINIVADSDQGLVEFSVKFHDDPSTRFTAVQHRFYRGVRPPYYPSDPGTMFRRLLIFEAERSNMGPGNVEVKYVEMRFPHWVAFFALAGFPLVRFLRHRARSLRIRSGRCVCGYDLRATPAQCPECGMIPEKTK
jgi:hypothetical protein